MQFRRAVKRSDPWRRWFGVVLGVALAFAPLVAFADCKPHRARPKIVLADMGPCGFDPGRMAFAGDAIQQAACLLRPVRRLAKLGPPLIVLPEVLASRIGSDFDLPSREALIDELIRQDVREDFAAYLWLPVTRANDNDPDAPLARYFVLHDTSGPNLGRRPWPADLDHNRKINNLAGHRCEDGWESAHAIINRGGDMLIGHDFLKPWRATKFERAVDFGGRLKGLFLHVEMIQPRRREAHVVVGHRGRSRTRYRSVAPMPGFTTAQYDRLALAYTIASIRRGSWLIPAFHAVIDNHIRNGHDDPQNFELPDFAGSLERLLDRLRQDHEPDGTPLLSHAANEPDR
jgi:hypothetical protein